jgi:hypothetical protein
MALPVRPNWQTVTLFFFGMTVFSFEVGLNAVTGQQPNYSIVGGAVGMMLGGPVLNKSSNNRKGKSNDDADAE